MAALKIFISHSSRLRDDETSEPQALANWQLLQETCRDLVKDYGDTIEIVVDFQGLRPSDDWERCLNQWLAECHAAIILFSARAIGESNWVRKEATILSWRAALDPGFRLFPVLLETGSAATQLDDDPYFRMLNLTRTQCVQGATTAREIVDAIRQRLGDPQSLGGSSETPYEKLVAAVARTIAADTEVTTLDALWSELCPGTAPLATGQPDRRTSLARQLASHLLNRGEESLERFQTMLDHLHPRPLRERAEELLKWVRPLWIDIEAAGIIPAARANGKHLALNGELVGQSEVEKLGSPHFTLDRYLERAWPGCDRIKVIPVSDISSTDTMQEQIRRGYFPGSARPSDTRIDRQLREDTRHLIVFVANPVLAGGIPDERLLRDIQRVQNQYGTLTFVVHIGEQMPAAALPEDLLPVVPAVDTDAEWDHYAAEIKARELLDRKYGRPTP
ncbi:MAG: toll/interleukin-1 receptor domain-containing protein [Candidatus Accumulibacter sp.]|uniref:Toll/interleukin-1 receptor domain-containing protein n=1 Tax=Candidatus Accumulibacter affinis TaxID=2954384 RepID=A0A935T9W7_9PROT|nr:toll/interleukin-1 receptor domain-containing protein [Candidatus Accumulibacter affinis]